MSVAAMIRDARVEAGLTQDDLAERSGVRQPNIAAYEAGKRTPSPAMLKRLMDAARVRPSVLLHRHRDAILAIASSNRATKVRVFGSIARGEDRPDSDIDLLVGFDKGASLFDLAELSDEMEELLGRRVDVISEAGLQARHAQVLRDAVPL